MRAHSSAIPELLSWRLPRHAAGTSGGGTITITPQNGFNGMVSLSASGLPSGVTALFNPSSATTTSTLTLTASATAAIGATSVTTGTSASLTHQTSVALTVNPAGNYTLTASPSSLSIAQSAKGTSSIAVNPLNGFNGAVSLSASGLPGGVTASFNPASTTGASTLTLSASANAATGTFNVTITGTCANLSDSTTISLTVTAQPNFTLSASPTSLSIARGTAGTATITIWPSNGFSAGVNLSASGMRSGTTTSFSPNPILGRAL